MPNWTSCRLEAPRYVLDKYMSKDEYGQPLFDFNKVIPRPEIYDDPDLVAGGDESLCLYWYHTDRGSRQTLPLPERFARDIEYCRQHDDEFYRRGEKYDRAIREYGYPNWYDWDTHNWGTKWNACYTYLDGDYCVCFDTAWCYPEPVIKKLFEENPDVWMTFTWKDEDYNGTHTIWKDEYGKTGEFTEWEKEPWGEEVA